MKHVLLLFFVLLLAASFTIAQRQVTGRVTDARDGSPISGVSVTVKGTRIGTTTDFEGLYSITVPPAGVISFSGVGFSPREMKPEADVINVGLSVAQHSLEEVVVTGYTTQNKRQVTGSVSKLSGDEIKMQPVATFDKALQGKVPGLLSQSQSGQPGSSAQITIRGKGSIGGTNTPLFIVDGIQVKAEDFASINPGDIETYTVLKDASSAAIYGSRGSNGVIVITTKQGVEGKTKVNYNFQYGYSQLPRNRLELMNSAQKLDYEVNYDRPDYGKNYFGWTPEEIDSMGKIDNHIQEILFHKGITQQHELNASGGNENTHFFLSGSYFNQEGVVRTTGLKRYTGRANIDNTFGNFKVGVNMTLGYSRLIGTRENDVYVGSPLNAIRWFNPYIGLYDANGNYQNDYLQGQPNPVRELMENDAYSDQLKGLGRAYLEFNFPWVAGLKARTLWGADYTQSEKFNYFDRTTDQGAQSTGSRGQVDRSFSKTFRYTGTTSLGYQHSFGAHDVNLALYNEIIESKTQGFGFSGFGLVGPFKNEAGITPGSSSNGFIPTVNGNGTRNALLSYFVDGVYGFRKKYYISAGARRDGSSRLTEDARFANFGQVGLSWIVTEEPFMRKAANWLTSLKYKVSYGSAGSQGVEDFKSRELLDPSVYNGAGGLLLTNLERPLTWERKLMFNTGIEFTLFRGRAGGTVEFYNNITKDLFLDRQLSRTTGFSSITNNLGRLQNQGIEISVEGRIIQTKDFSWSVEANYTHNKNKLIDQAGQDENVDGNTVNKVGYPLNTIYLVRYAGVDPENGDALYYKKDGKSTTNVYDPDDRMLGGPSDPPNFGGFSTTVNYKGIECSVLFSYASGNFIYNNDRTNVENSIYWYSNLATSMLREWQKRGDVTDIPSSFNDLHLETTRFVEKGDYLRLRNVMLSYNLPGTLLNRVKVRSLRLFAQGQNLHVWHNFLGYDPEVTSGTLLGSQYPQLETITFGLNLGL